MDNFSLPEMMQRIMKHPTATFSAVAEGREKIHVQMPVTSVERFRGTLETVKRELEQTDPNTKTVIFCPTEAEIARLTEVLGHIGERLSFVKGNLSGGFELFGQTADISRRKRKYEYVEEGLHSAAVCRLPSAVFSSSLRSRSIRNP
jgi:hypothetical protein